MKNNRKSLILIIATILASNYFDMTAKAAIAPDAGQTDKSVRERQIFLPNEETPNIVIKQDNISLHQNTQGPKIFIENVHITGQNIFGENILLDQIRDGFGKELSLNDMEYLAWRITRYFRSQGYMVATAYIPAQKLNDRTLEINVLVGQYGKIKVQNQSTIKNEILNNFIASLRPGDYLHEDELERTILLINDISGIKANAVLMPGDKFGTTDLIINTENTKQINGSTTTDNYGNWFVGKNRGGVAVEIENPGHVGDQLTINGIFAGTGMDNQNLSYQLPMGTQGWKAGIGFERTHYLLGKDFSELDASGEAMTSSIFGTYPFIRSRKFNMYGKIGFYTKTLKDRQDANNTVSDKHSRLESIGLNANKYDDNGRGITSLAISLSKGKLFIETPDNYTIDKATAKANGGFNKATLDFFRIRQISDRLSYTMAANGQISDKNLDSSEKMSLGGANGVRAYPQGEAEGDQGYLFTGELQWNMPTEKFKIATFIDVGHVKVNKHPWDNSKNERTISGAGLGLIGNWKDFSVRLDYAWKLTSEKAVSDDDCNGRFWLQCTKKF